MGEAVVGVVGVAPAVVSGAGAVLSEADGSPVASGVGDSDEDVDEDDGLGDPVADEDGDEEADAVGEAGPSEAMPGSALVVARASATGTEAVSSLCWTP